MGAAGLTAALGVASVLLTFIVFVVTAYGVRHYLFTMNRLFGRQRHPYVDVQLADWPSVTVLIPAHNEEAVIANILEALLEADYPAEHLTLLAIDDRSTDGTRAILDEFVHWYPDRIRVLHRDSGNPGKAAALREASALVTTEIQLVFDADYLPGRGLVKQLVAPFLDPEVGAVMGRVVPLNTQRNLLTRILDMERAGGYQVDQQARMNLRLVPQYGGTVGGVRTNALVGIGGWREQTLAEDTDATYRLLLAGWQVAYQNRSECYEEVPETWEARVRQIMRWARGHNEALGRYAVQLVGSRRVSLRQRVDGLFLLGVYMIAPLLVLGWLLALMLFYAGANPAPLVWIVLAVTCYSTFGNFAVFYEVAAAARLDGTYGRIRLLPLLALSLLVNLVSVTRAIVGGTRRNGIAPLVWQKTTRFRKDGNR